MEAKKNLCGMIPENLHAKAIEEKEQLGLKTLGDYVELVLKERFEGGKITMAETKTLAFKITEELDQRLKNFIAAEKKHGRKITQKEFVIGLIEQALDAYEAQNQPAEMSEHKYAAPAAGEHIPGGLFFGGEPPCISTLTI